MNCDTRLLHLYADGELDQRDIEAVNKHIAQCHACQTELNELQSMHTVLSSYQPCELDNELLQALQSIPAQANKRFSIFKLLPQELALSAASIIFALIIGALISYFTLQTVSIEYIAQNDYIEQVSMVSLFTEF